MTNYSLNLVQSNTFASFSKNSIAIRLSNSGFSNNTKCGLSDPSNSIAQRGSTKNRQTAAVSRPRITAIARHMVVIDFIRFVIEIQTTSDMCIRYTLVTLPSVDIEGEQYHNRTGDTSLV